MPANEQVLSGVPGAAGGRISPIGLVGMPDLYPSGDTTGATDTAAYNAVVASGKTHIVWAPGIFYLTQIVVNKRLVFRGVPGALGGAAYRPRLFLANSTDTHLCRVTTTGSFVAHEIDFWGNRANNASGFCIYLDDDNSGSYVSANAISLFNCIVREGRSGGIYGGLNRNVGVIADKSFVIGHDGSAVVIKGQDWIVTGGYEIGESGGYGVEVYNDSNDFTCGDVYLNAESGFYLGPDVRICCINGNQINSNGKNGVDTSAVTPYKEVAIQVQGNIFYSNSRSVTNTYADVVINNQNISAVGNVHVPVIGTSSKVKYLYSTPVEYDIPLTIFGAVYTDKSYGADRTRDARLVSFFDSQRANFAGGKSLTAISKTNDPSVWFRSYMAYAASESFSIDHAGAMKWGPGEASPVDTSFGRQAPGVVGVGAGNCLRTGAGPTASRPSASAVGAGAEFFDTTLGKPIWSNGSVWKDATGATV